MKFNRILIRFADYTKDALDSVFGEGGARIDAVKRGLSGLAQRLAVKTRNDCG